MTTLQRYYRNRVIYDMTTYDPNDFTDKVILCVPRFAWLQARNLIRSYGVRKSAYAVAYSAGGYTMPDDSLFDQIDSSISEFLSEDDMSCDLVQAINDLAAVITATAGCNDSCGEGGSFGAGTTEPSTGTFVDTGSNWPDGFANRTEYNTYKCSVANAIIAQMNSDMGWLKTASIATLTASALAFALLTPIPFDDILVLIGALIALAAQGVLVGFATEITDAIAADNEAYVCALYAATGSGDARTSLNAQLDSDVSAGAQALASYFIKNDSLNALFEDSATYSQVASTMGVDCAGCVCPSFGTAWTVEERGFDYAILESQFGAGSEFLYFSARTTDANAVTGGGGPFGPYCASNGEYTVTVLSGSISDYGTRDDAGLPIITTWSTFPGSYTGTARHMYLRQLTSSGRFRIRIEYT